ncbi:hypothetical protein [Nostoc sp.]|uniref:hypothetical protein n=1 Tax=Nostoc sp. TaxID=1180 RepID=UPI002FF939DE
MVQHKAIPSALCKVSNAISCVYGHWMCCCSEDAPIRIEITRRSLKDLGLLAQIN